MLGVLSLIVWALIIVMSVKYLVFVLRADNHGEGGILALTALATPIKPTGRSERGMADRSRDLWRGAAVWRRHHHAVHFGAGRG